ncbi:MAG: 4Fe-4S binding protein [Deltaproteobacteria bacterium]|jgi:polyferredoxin|nr:4Fe-4S binding protein [Deltaproteobacteria bacterium]
MRLRVIRLLVQHLSFIVLMYGGRFGIRLGPALPCFACPYVNGCGGHCYLMGLQGYIGFGVRFSDLIGYDGLRALFYFAVFAVLVALLGKLWCGFICPFGLLQDWLTLLRKKLRIAGAKIAPGTLKTLGKIKYVFLAVIVGGPVLINLGVLHSDFYIPFCQMFCPGKPLLPLFGLETRHLALDATNLATTIVTSSSLLVTGASVAGMFVRPRFFCIFCPLLALIHFFRPLTLILLKKEPSLCHGCGTCQRVCPMDVTEVYLEKAETLVQTEDCVNCGDCVASCPARGCLSLRGAGRVLVASSPKRYLEEAKK